MYTAALAFAEEVFVQTGAEVEAGTARLEFFVRNKIRVYRVLAALKAAT